MIMVHDKGGSAPLITPPIVSAAKRVDIRANIRANCALVHDRLEMEAAHDRPLSLACYGPSLVYTTWEIEGDVMSVSGAHDFLLANGIVPKFHADCDPRPHKAKFLSCPDSRIEYLMASQFPPEAIEKILAARAVCRLWHLDEGDDIRAFLYEIGEHGLWIQGGGSIGHRAIGVAYAKGYRTFHIFGMDCSYTDKTHAGEHYGNAPNRIKVMCGDKEFSTSHVLVEYARQFIGGMAAMEDCRFYVHGDGLLQTMIQEGQRDAA